MRSYVRLGGLALLYDTWAVSVLRPYSYSTLRCPEWLACSGRHGPSPSRPGRGPAAVRRPGPASGGDVTAGDVTSPPGVPPGPRPMLWRTLCVQVC